ncbi:MAG: hypothetical protein KatS3mg090_0471 [Patescibacteria group bacterium]|nr:MAG: hypothetical protein KatS3mg090_0471 [Patescibacteria group bacterium]
MVFISNPEQGQEINWSDAYTEQFFKMIEDEIATAGNRQQISLLEIIIDWFNLISQTHNYENIQDVIEDILGNQINPITKTLIQKKSEPLHKDNYKNLLDFTTNFTKTIIDAVRSYCKGGDKSQLTFSKEELIRFIQGAREFLK